MMPLVATICLGSACDGIASLSPVLRDSDAIEMPELTGSWTNRDPIVISTERRSWTVPVTLTARVERMPGSVPQYRVMLRASGSADPSDSTAASREDTHTWFVARVARFGGRTVAEVVPDDSSDARLAEVVDRYGALVRRPYYLVPFTVDARGLRFDSFASWVRRGALESGPCPTPHNDDDGPRTLTGETEQARAGMLCLLTQPNVMDTTSTLAVRLSRLVPP
jgi:hypothetical protein